MALRDVHCSSMAAACVGVRQLGCGFSAGDGLIAAWGGRQEERTGGQEDGRQNL